MKLVSVERRLEEIRSSSQYKEWRKSVLKRDRRKCVLCDSKKRLEVDHIKSLALYPQLALEINNGRVLCRECHKKTDTYGVYSSYKGNDIHPLLKGDLYYKIKSLPQVIDYTNRHGKIQQVGLSFKYNTIDNTWIAGYRFAGHNLTCVAKTIDEAVDNLFDKLKYAPRREYKV